MVNWADEYPLVSPPPDNPVRGDAAGMGDEFLVKLRPKGTPGANKQFLSRDGTWFTFTTTDLTTWGSITGEIVDQLDLQDEFALKADRLDISAVGYSGRYGDLLDKPALGTLAAISYPGGDSRFLNADGGWSIPVDVEARWGEITGNLNAQTDLSNALALKAPLSNPTFTGNVRVPTRAVDDSSDLAINSEWFFGQAFNSVPAMDGVPSSGDSLRWARGNHRHPTDDTRAPLDAPNLTGVATSPTPPVGNVSKRIANTEFVAAAIAGAGLTPPPSDDQFYAMLNGAWTVINLSTRWDKT